MRSNFINNFPTGPECDPEPETQSGMTEEEWREAEYIAMQERGDETEYIDFSRQEGNDGDSGS